MLDQHHGSEGVGLEGTQGVVVVYLTGCLLGVQDAWDG
jgi:hypothetical protein